jgi:putative glycosyltransferase (TIGR04348 family)
MPGIRVVIVTPAPPGSRSGNRNTAVRWARILRRLGHRVAVATAWQGEPCDLAVVLHARRGHAAAAALRRANPGMPLILALTGTDLYRDIRSCAQARESLELADRYVVLQDEGPLELAPELRGRTRVIYQSEIEHYPWRPLRRFFRFCVLGHLREEKDPFRAAIALSYMRTLPSVRLTHAGGVLAEEMAAQARALEAQDPRYRWLGELPHWRALRLMAASHAMIISSRLEGGAHVVSEAIAAGVPVIASAIPGNRGMLGADYPGYYPPEDAQALAATMRRTVEDPGFLAALRAAAIRRRPLVEPRRELECWRALLAELRIPR